MGDCEYLAKARRLHSRAVAAHAEWVAGLSVEQRAEMLALGVLAGPEDSHEVGGHSPAQLGDIADSALASVEFDPADVIDEHAETLADEFGITLPLARRILEWHLEGVEAALRIHEADLLAIVVGGLLASDNVRIATAGLAFATGMAATSGLGTQAQFARSAGVSRTIVSRSTLAWKRQFNLRANVGQKSDEACATYSAVNRERHWRKQKVSASLLSEKLLQLRRTK